MDGCVEGEEKGRKEGRKEGRKDGWIWEDGYRRMLGGMLKEERMWKEGRW